MALRLVLRGFSTCQVVCFYSFRIYEYFIEWQFASNNKSESKSKRYKKKEWSFFPLHVKSWQRKVLKEWSAVWRVFVVYIFFLCFRSGTRRRLPPSKCCLRLPRLKSLLWAMDFALLLRITARPRPLYVFLFFFCSVIFSAISVVCAYWTETIFITTIHYNSPRVKCPARECARKVWSRRPRRILRGCCCKHPIRPPSA